MTKKPSKPFRMAPLQKLAVKPIEDPTEQAALDQKLKRSEGGTASVPPEGHPPSETTPLAILELCHRLSAEGRLLVATELVAQLSVDQRSQLVERWVAQLPRDAVRRVEERLRGQAGSSSDGNYLGGKKSK
jgi:hypothetical protein